MNKLDKDLLVSICLLFARLYLCKGTEGDCLYLIYQELELFFMNYFLGIDIAKTNHVASLINNTGYVVIRAIKFTNSNEGG